MLPSNNGAKDVVGFCITGATGLVGSSILRSLVKQCRRSPVHAAVKILCPVRCKTTEEGLRRLFPGDDASKLRDMRSFVVPVPCDLRESSCVAVLSAALKDAGISVLASTIHCAAVDSYVAPLSELIDANVVTTENMISFHNRHNDLRPLVHSLRSSFLYTSSCAARLAAPYSESRLMTLSPHGLLTNYAITKHLAALRVLQDIHGSGTRPVVLEIGYVFNDDIVNWKDESNAVELVWSLCTRIGCAVQLGSSGRIDMTHSDDIADYVAALALGNNIKTSGSDASSGLVMNLQRPDAFDWDAVAVPAMKQAVISNNAAKSERRRREMVVEPIELGYADWYRRYARCVRGPLLRRLTSPETVDHLPVVFSPGDVLPLGGKLLTADMLRKRLCTS